MIAFTLMRILLFLNFSFAGPLNLENTICCKYNKSIKIIPAGPTKSYQGFTVKITLSLDFFT